jgi:hypothetical protein
MTDFLEFDRDPASGTVSKVAVEDDKMMIRTEQDVSAIKEQAKNDQLAWQPGQMIGNTQLHRQKVATIPTSIYFQLVAKYGTPAQNPADWKKWLSDNPAFKTTRGTF